MLFLLEGPTYVRTCICNLGNQFLFSIDTLNKLGASTNGARKLVTEVFQSETCPNRSRKMEGKPKTKTKVTISK